MYDCFHKLMTNNIGTTKMPRCSVNQRK